MSDLAKGAHVSPNIQSDSAMYEIENIACDPENKIEAYLKSLYDWQGKAVLDIGCGTGFHLPYYAKKASHVFGIEPHDETRLKAMTRIIDLGLKDVSIIKGTAEAISLKESMVDLAYARFAYFWGEGCEKGINEVFRTLKPQGLFCIIDNNLEKGTFGPWVKKVLIFLILNNVKLMFSGKIKAFS